MRKRLPAARAAAEACEEQHRPIRSLVWQVFGGFVMVVLTLTLAGAAHLGDKADAGDVRELAARTREAEQTLSEIREHLAELRSGQQHMQEDLRWVRTALDEQWKR